MDQLQKIYSIKIKNDDDRSTSVTKYRLGLRLLGEVRGGGRERERERERGGRREKKRERVTSFSLSLSPSFPAGLVWSGGRRRWFVFAP